MPLRGEKAWTTLANLEAAVHRTRQERSSIVATMRGRIRLTRVSIRESVSDSARAPLPSDEFDDVGELRA